MLTFLVWLCYVYAAIWLLVALVFYCAGRMLARMSRTSEPPTTVWQALFVGLVWPAVLAVVVITLTRWRAMADSFELAEQQGDEATGAPVDVD